VADVYDALTSVRPYKKAWASEDAFAHLRAQRGAHFDPRLVDAFLAVRDDILRVQREWSDAPTARPSGA